MRKCGVVLVTKLKKIQFRRGRSDVRAGPVVRSSDVRCQGDFRARDEQLGFVVVMAKMVKSRGFCGWKGCRQGGKR